MAQESRGLNQPQKIIVHHTAVAGEGDQFPGVERYHQSREFPRSSYSFYCGYHRFIEKDGRTIKARADDDEGAHTKGQNFNSIGIGLAGNFDLEMPTAKQISNLCGIIDELIQKYQIRAADILPHRYFSNTSCYGAKLADNWAQQEFLKYKYSILHRLLLNLKNLLEQYVQKILATKK